MPTRSRELSPSISIAVVAESSGYPRSVDGVRIEAVTESWLVEDPWWSSGYSRRRYWKVVLARGGTIIIFRDLRAGGWYRQIST